MSQNGCFGALKRSGWTRLWNTEILQKCFSFGKKHLICFSILICSSKILNCFLSNYTGILERLNFQILQFLGYFKIWEFSIASISKKFKFLNKSKLYRLLFGEYALYGRGHSGSRLIMSDDAKCKIFFSTCQLCHHAMHSGDTCGCLSGRHKIRSSYFISTTT